MSSPKTADNTMNINNESSSSISREQITVEEHTDWQSKMLRKIIDSASPVPIKVACTVTPPGIPEYLSEEYHGKISKEEERRLLEGKSGRYIVRDSFTATRLHEYTLAFNHDHDIQHVKLIYNPLTKTFKTDSSTKVFKTVLELMTDVLELFRDVKRRESSTTLISKKEKYSKPHSFRSHTYKHPKWCDECGNFLWGFFNQGYKCEDCGLNVHKNCKELAPLPCFKVVFGRSSNNKEAEDRIFGKKRGSKQDESLTTNTERESPPNNYIVIDHFINKSTCKYFETCSRFLSAFNIRDTYVDMKDHMTRCFCKQCVEYNSPENGEMCSFLDLKQWTRFQLNQENNKSKENLNEWEIVYFAVKPQFIRDFIKGCYNPVQSDVFELPYVAPSLAYTVQDMINENWSYKFSDTQTGGELFAQNVIEAYLRPDSYDILPPQRHDVETHNCGAPLVAEKWKVKNWEDIYPKSVLVKIFKKDI